MYLTKCNQWLVCALAACSPACTTWTGALANQHLSAAMGSRFCLKFRAKGGLPASPCLGPISRAGAKRIVAGRLHAIRARAGILNRGGQKPERWRTRKLNGGGQET